MRGYLDGHEERVVGPLSLSLAGSRRVGVPRGGVCSWWRLPDVAQQLGRAEGGPRTVLHWGGVRGYERAPPSGTYSPGSQAGGVLP